MKYFFFILIMYQFFFVRAPIPTWNFSSQSISKSTYHKYDVYKKTGYNIEVQLWKEIKIIEGVLTPKNYVTIGSTTKEVPFEDIESHYANKYAVTGPLICPKGKFHPYIFNNESYLKPSDFSEKRDWDLKCFDHGTGHLLFFYNPNKYYTFYSKCTGNCDTNIKRIGYVADFYDFTLEDGTYGDNYKYRFPCLIKSGSNLMIYGSVLTMNPNDDNVNKQDPGGTNLITEAKAYTQAYFDKDDSNYFYFFTYNNVSDFVSGYYQISINTANYDKDGAITFNSRKDNTESPFSFIDNVEIKEMKFIKGTKYAYYIIKNNDRNISYYGLVDIKNNKVLYNLEQETEMKSFVPISNNGEMLAVTSTSIFIICAIKNGESCDTSCSDSNIALDPEGNKCQSSCDDGKIKLMPEGICIREELCNLTIYIIKTVDEKNQCGLCSYFNSNGKKYRFIGGKECLSTKPSHAEDYNTNLFLLKCETNYTLYNDSCIPDTCYERCESCSEYSTNINDQKCTSCKSGYIKDNDNNGNCLIPPTTIVEQPPTTIVTNSPTTIIIPPPPTTTIITPPPTTVIETPPPTTVITNSPTTIIIEETEIIKRDCVNKRCKECSEESDKKKLCISCDESKYKKVNYTLNEFSKFFDCKSIEDLQIKYYYDESKEQYKPCYEHCKTCTSPRNATHQNCLECDINYMFRPGDNPHNNCVVYSQFYYLSPYNEYKPLNSPQCPEEAKYTIKNELTNKTSCIYDCKIDKEYKYLYNGNCYKSCNEIEGTTNVNFLCKETDTNKIYISEKELYINKDNNDTLSIIQTLAKTYAQEYNYTVNHISLFSNEEMTIALYKNKSIISDTNLKMPSINFGESYDKIKAAYNLSDDIIIAVAEIKNKNNINNNPYSFYLFYHPKTGLKLEVGELCQNDTIEVKENLLEMLDENSENYELQTALTKQGINIFDINDPYYKDICYDFENPKKRDMALKDRIKETYVNVTLCDDGCVNTGIDVKNNVATCNCKFNDVTNNDVIHENAALEYLVGEFFDLINSSNILVLKCYKNLIKYFTQSIGGMLVLIFIALDIIFSLVFFFYELIKMKRYIYTMSEKFVFFLNNYPHLVKFFPPKRNPNKNKSERIKNKHNTKEDKNNKSDKKRTTINFLSNIKPQINSKDLIVFSDKKNSNILIEEKGEEKSENTNELKDEGKKLKKYFKEYLSTSLDDMEYDEAIKLDKRSFCGFFCDSLLEKQSFAYTFIASDPINTRMIKFILFSLNITLYFVVNGLFFSESFISELYHTEEKDENFFSFIPRTIDKIIYTTIVAIFIGYMTDFFFVDEKKVKGVLKREKKNKLVLRRSITLLIGEIQKRYISFIIMTFVVLLLSLYYVLCFNYVYPKTQIEWVKSSILIIIIMQLISILKCFYETVFRFLSFKCESEKLYKVSKIFDGNS